MKKIVIINLILLLFVFAGCESKIIEENDGKQSSVEVKDSKATGSEEVVNSGDNQTVKNVLDLSGQSLKKVPEYVFSEVGLKELDLSDNDLEGALPGEIRFLENLEKLNVSKNNMTGIPAEIGQLKKLKYLDYSDNDITGLPLEIGNLKNLEELDLSNNNYSDYDLGLIKEALPNLKVIVD